MRKNPKKGLMSALWGVIAFFIACRILSRVLPSLGSLFLLLVKLSAVGVVVLVIAVIAAGMKEASKSSSSGSTTSAALTTDQKAAIQSVKQMLVDQKLLANKIRDTEVRSGATGIFPIADKIVSTLQKQPEEIVRVRQFTKYYLPTLGKVLTKFQMLEESKMDTADLKPKVLSCFKDIQSATEKLFENLFKNDVLDLTVEMKALSNALIRDGLLTESDLKEEEPDETPIELKI